MQMLLTKAKGRKTYMPILVDYSTGLRRGELLGLKWDNVDLERGVLSIVQALKQANKEVYSGRPKNKSSRRQVAISPTIVEALR